MTFGIAIPTYIKHLSKLDSLLNSIQNSTVLPNEVSVSCSSYDNSDYYIDYSKYTFKLNVHFHSEYKNPSMNRNYAADKLNTDIISFIDGDDIPHPQRIEFILNSFINNGCDSILHNYKLSSNIDEVFQSNRYESIFYLHKYVNIPGVDNYPINVSYPHSDIYHLPYQNAHISVLKSVFDDHRYDESEIIKYKEDSEYCNRLVKNGIKISYILNPLSLYIK